MSESIDKLIKHLDELDAQRTPGEWAKSHQWLWSRKTRETIADFFQGRDFADLPNATAKANANARFVAALVKHWPEIREELSKRAAA